MDTNYVNNLLTLGKITPLKDPLDKVTIPIWFNEEKFKRAQQYFHRNFAAIYYGTICGLLPVLSVPSIMDALLFTTGGKPSFRVAVRRYLGALRHTVNWYSDDLVKPTTSSWQSLNHVRQVHASMQRRATAHNCGVIISQRDMAITQFAFIGFTILTPAKLGAQHEPRDLDALCHFWRVVGHLLGIEDEFNLCTESLEESQLRMSKLLIDFIKPSFEQRTEKCEQVYRELLGGLWCFNVLLDHQALTYCAGRVAGLPEFSHYWASDVETGQFPKLYEMMQWKSRFILFVILSIHEVLLKRDLFRRWFNAVLIVAGQIGIWLYSVLFSRYLGILENSLRRFKRSFKSKTCC